MQKLLLLFTKDGLQYQLLRGRTVMEENSYVKEEGVAETFLQDRLGALFSEKTFSEISVISALNHFTVLPAGFREHDAGLDLIALNAPVQRETEELMLALNKNYGIQFYYTMPKSIYAAIKATNKPTVFNFSGEQFLRKLATRGRKEIHINLYQNQCEFFALNQKKVVLYNNLDVNSEVDFLYFVMFTLSKINFSLNETRFYVYGETSVNETFISELRKFVRHFSISFDNIHKRNFILKQP